VIITKGRTPLTDLHALLKSRFGFEQFRPKQEESIKDLFQHRRILCIQPTGHGKSLLYQLPSLMLEGMTLVISPLLALVRDQHNQLRDRFQVAATAINSDQTIEENDQIKEQVRQGAYKILFIAPEPSACWSSMKRTVFQPGATTSDPPIGRLSKPYKNSKRRETCWSSG
jgi:superfamily II DNA helicase RecQ